MPGVYCGTQGNVQPNGEFVLERYYAIKHEVVYSCCPNKYPDLTYYVLLRRRPMFYVFNLILPCVLINSIGKNFLSVSEDIFCTKFLFYFSSFSFIESDKLDVTACQICFDVLLFSCMSDKLCILNFSIIYLFL